MTKCFIIAEAGVNHNGDEKLAYELIAAAAEAKADAVKFQTFKAERLVSQGTPKANYQLEQTDKSESHFDMIQRLEISPDQHFRLKEECEKYNIEFMSTPFDTISANFLVKELKVKRLKIPSGEIINGPLLDHVGRLGVPIILSSGMSSLSEIKQALKVLSHSLCHRDGPPDFKALIEKSDQRALNENISLLHCTTEYPAPFNEINLRAMDNMRKEFRLPVGYSDHSLGIHIPLAAVARGARIIEKHFTLDHNLSGPDHAASLEPAELIKMVQLIRDVEVALGDGIKKTTKSEKKNLPVVRKSLVAKVDISKGETFTAENLSIKRPGDGISPMQYWDYLGKIAEADYKKDALIK
ncbi:N-acetylneuraminate synthase [Terasakiella sp. SH-1]|uniref:N-acetylneuraminate synthase n=1 Tax=Terasakiella sp. SH-1 TaxID=2560057 RepID=UPI0010749871|nr:N-acetylneuraminate synthase [Terasakiella sp. SH-1]